MYSSSYIKKLLSFSALCFFAPFVHFFLSTKDFWLNTEDKDFIRSYIKLWYFNILYILLIIWAYILFLFISFSPFLYIYQYGVIPFLWILILQIIFLLEWKQITFSNIFNPAKREWELFDIIRTYTPWYNFYLTISSNPSSLGNDKPYLLKESIFIRTIFILSIIFLPAIIGKSLFLIILFRIISLIVWFDFLPSTFKKKLNWLFWTNVEELRWTLIGSVLFFVDVFKKKVNKDAMPTYLKYAQDTYWKYYPKEVKEIFIEYLILFGIIIYWIVNDIYWQAWRESFDFYQYLAIILILIKYTVSLKYNKLTLIPWIHEVVHYIWKFILHFYNKFLWKN